MRKLVICVVMIAIIMSLALSAFACAPGEQPTTPSTPTPTPSKPTPAPAPKPTPTPEAKVLKFGTYWSTADLKYGELEKFAVALEERSGGRLKVELFPSSQLFPINEPVTSMRGRAADIGITVETYQPGLVDLDADFLLAVGTFITDWHKLLAVANEVRPIINEADWSRHKVMAIGNWATAPQYPIFRKPLKTLEDWKGRIFKAPGGPFVTATEGLGASPVMISATEMYMAGQRGTIDGAQAASNYIKAQKLYEVMPYFVDYAMYNPIQSYVINLDAWNELSKDLQDVLLECCDDLTANLFETIFTNDRKIIQEFIDKELVEYYDPPPEEKAQWDAIVYPALEEYLEATFERYGENGKKVKAIFEKYRG